MIYTQYTYYDAATEWLQKKQEDGELGSARELKTMRYEQIKVLTLQVVLRGQSIVSVAPVRPVQATASIKQLAGSTPTRGRAV